MLRISFLFFAASFLSSIFATRFSTGEKNHHCTAEHKENEQATKRETQNRCGLVNHQRSLEKKTII